VDIDECAGEAGGVSLNCTTDQYCANTPGSAACRSCHAGCERSKGCSGGDAVDCVACRAGYRRQGEAGPCEDIDECAEGKTCEVGKYCLNGAGWARCQECDNSCDATAGCRHGGASGCNACAAGYIWKGGKGSDTDTEAPGRCEDVDECAATESPCPEGQQCDNEPGSFACRCPDGQSLEVRRRGWGLECIDGGRLSLKQHTFCTCTHINRPPFLPGAI
jgi:hypothetical protein